MTKKTCRSTKILKSVVILFTSTAILNAKLVVKVDEPKRSGGKAIIKLTIRNTFKEKVESARASVLLLTDDDRLAGQSSIFDLGGDEGPAPQRAHHPPIAPEEYEKADLLRLELCNINRQWVFSLPWVDCGDRPPDRAQRGFLVMPESLGKGKAVGA